MEIIKKLEEIRLDKKLSLKNFGKSLGVSQRTYINWLDEKTKPSKINLHQIKKYLNEHEKQLSKE